MPAGSLVTSGGGEPKGVIQFELVEALSTSDQVLANLTTTSGGAPLETGGMLYLNATSNGEQLQVNPDIPLLIDVPTSDRKPGMSAYRGTRNAEGNMDWVDPKPIREFLTTVSFDELDFLPGSFANSVSAVCGTFGYTVATPELVDSLYYALAVGQVNVDLPDLDINEPYLQGQVEIENGAYTNGSYHSNVDTAQREEGLNEADWFQTCGISPAWIKAMKSKELSNTFLATKAFERRMKVIHRTHSPAILQFYLKNLDKRLGFCDSLVVDALTSVNGLARIEALSSASLSRFVDQMQPEDSSFFYSGEECVSQCAKAELKAFKSFASEGLTNVDVPSDQLQMLARFVQEQKDAVDKALKACQASATEALKNELATKQWEAEYREVLWKREKHRMESYSFEWTDTGWVNVDRGVVPKTEFNTATPRPIVVEVPEGETYDRVHTYLVMDYVKSIYRLNTANGSEHRIGNGEKGLLMMAYEPATCVTIAFRGKQMFYASQSFVPKQQPNLVQDIKPAKLSDITYALNKLDQGTPENSILVDLEFQQERARFERVHQQHQARRAAMQSLARTIYYCCFTFGEQ